MAIRGSRNGVFFADAIAILLWRERGIEFLKRQEALAKARKERSGGSRRRYLLFMAQQDEVVAMLHAMALCYLELYLPFVSAIKHVEDIAVDLPILDQTVFNALEHVDVDDLLDGPEGSRHPRPFAPPPRVRIDVVRPMCIRLRLCHPLHILPHH